MAREALEMEYRGMTAPAVQGIIGTEVGDTVTGGDRRTNTRALVVGFAFLTLILLGLATAFVLDRLNRPPVGVSQGPAGGNQAQQPPGQSAPADGTAIRNLADIGRLRSAVEQDIARAYFRYWDVYAAAMESRSSARLAEVTAGGRLQEATDEVGDLVAAGIAAKIQVAHSFTITQVGDTEATVRDDYVDSSYAIDPSTRQPVGAPGVSERSVVTLNLRKVDGTWKVVGGRREAG